MKCVPVSRLSNDALIQELDESVAHDCPHSARQVALIAEVQKRRLYAPAGYPSMYAYCVGKLHLSEDAAYKRIKAARAARKCPMVLAAMAEGRVHLSGIVVLRPYLTPANADELLRAATHKTKAEIQQLVAERFPKSDLPARVMALPSGATVRAPALEPGVLEQVPGPVLSTPESEPGELGPLSTPIMTLPPTAEPSRVTPLAPQRFGLQFTVDQAGHDLLRHVQNLLGNQVAPGDLAAVIVRALRVYAAQLEKQKFAATEQPAQNHRDCGPDSRHVPSRVKRAVWKRDGGQCTYVSDTGKRCDSRWELEFDHVHEYARGGAATASNIRLRCRAHNQLEAERTYGAAFMQHKRDAAQAARTQERAS